MVTAVQKSKYILSELYIYINIVVRGFLTLLISWRHPLYCLSTFLYFSPTFLKTQTETGGATYEQSDQRVSWRYG